MDFDIQYYCAKIYSLNFEIGELNKSAPTLSTKNTMESKLKEIVELNEKLVEHNKVKIVSVKKEYDTYIKGFR